IKNYSDEQSRSYEVILYLEIASANELFFHLEIFLLPRNDAAVLSLYDLRIYLLTCKLFFRTSQIGGNGRGN
ncbi:hypothetical protein EFY79_19085, partial [Hanamia caeni]